VDRVFTAGAALGPKAIQPSIEQGSAAALKALQAIGGGEKQPDKYASAVDQELCSHCGVCVSVCPHGAVQMTDQGSEVDPAFCQACGMCGASCPSHAATLRNFSDQRLLLEAAEAFSEAPPGEPRILALLCYWCSYGGVDLTGVGALDVPTCVRTMRIRCSSSVNLGLVLEIFRMGVDGIFVGGCPEGSCHHMWGNWLVQKRTAMMKSLLNQMGLDERRLRYDVIGIPHAQKFADEMHRMREDLGALGHNPWAREESVLRKGVEASWLAR
jgi:heterodisulfide reductase subunit A